jgi:hypothetical protein
MSAIPGSSAADETPRNGVADPMTISVIVTRKTRRRPNRSPAHPPRREPAATPAVSTAVR